MKTAENRIAYIDIAKSFGIILVIAGHVVSSDTTIKRIIYAFHMPLFFMLSGMLLKVHSKYSADTWKKLIERKSRTLILPYFVWALIYSSFSFRNLILIMYGTRKTLSMTDSLTSLWFLPVIFLSFMLSELILQLSSNTKHKLIITAASTVVYFVLGFVLSRFPGIQNLDAPWGIDIAFVGAAFMLLGKTLRSVMDFPGKTSHAIVTSVFFAAVFAFTIRYSNPPAGYVLMAEADYGSLMAFVLISVSGSMVIIMASCLIAHTRRLPPPVFSWTGARTLGIFVVHKPIAEKGRAVATRLGFSFNNIMIVIGITLATLIISGMIVAIIERIIPEIIGLRKTSKEVSFE